MNNYYFKKAWEYNKSQQIVETFWTYKTGV